MCRQSSLDSGTAVAEAASCPSYPSGNKVGVSRIEDHSENKEHEGHWYTDAGLKYPTRPTCGVDDDVVSSLDSGYRHGGRQREVFGWAAWNPSTWFLSKVSPTNATETAGNHQARDMRDTGSPENNLEPSFKEWSLPDVTRRGSQWFGIVKC